MTTFDCVSCDEKCLLQERKSHADPFRRGNEMRTCDDEMRQLGLSSDIKDYPMLPIECPDCGLKHITPRCEDDPAEAVKAIILCPECVNGGFGTTTYISHWFDPLQ
jgi:DNA-directed RNA polymerase subunit RPC12/RpoP